MGLDQQGAGLFRAIVFLCLLLSLLTACESDEPVGVDPRGPATRTRPKEERVLATIAAAKTAKRTTATARAVKIPACRVYGRDPSDPWNRLFCDLYAYVNEQGQSIGEDDLEPVGFMVSDPPYDLRVQRILASADDLLRSRADILPVEQLERAFLQRDLWKAAAEVVDVPVRVGDEAISRAWKTALLTRLVPLLRRLAMPRQVILDLPCNLQGDPQLNELLVDGSPWLTLGYAGRPAAERHVAGRLGSGTNQGAWLILTRGSSGLRSSHAWAKTLAATPRDEAAKLKIPPGTAFAIMRRMSLIDDSGQIIPTCITEALQMRTHVRLSPTEEAKATWSMRAFYDPQAFVVSRQALFAGQNGGLQEISVRGEGIPPDTCTSCHHGTTGASIQSVLQIRSDGLGAFRPDPLIVSTIDRELTLAATWLMAQDDFRTLMRYW